MCAARKAAHPESGPGAIAGKPLRVTLFYFLAVASRICRLPVDLGRPHMIGAGILGGIGFTMSILPARRGHKGVLHQRFFERKLSEGDG